MAFTISRAAGSGLAAGLRVTLGALLGKLSLLALAWTLITGTLSLSTDMLAALKIAGVASLCLLALALLRKPAVPDLSNALKRRSRAGPIGDIAGGFGANVSSPVNLVLLVALLPQVIDPRGATTTDLAIITAGMLAITAAPLIVVTALAARSVGRAPRGSVRVARAGAAALIFFAFIAAISPNGSANIGTKSNTPTEWSSPIAQPLDFSFHAQGRNPDTDPPAGPQDQTPRSEPIRGRADPPGEAARVEYGLR